MTKSIIIEENVHNTEIYVFQVYSRCFAAKLVLENDKLVLENDKLVLENDKNLYLRNGHGHAA